MQRLNPIDQFWSVYIVAGLLVAIVLQDVSWQPWKKILMWLLASLAFGAGILMLYKLGV